MGLSLPVTVRNVPVCEVWSVTVRCGDGTARRRTTLNAVAVDVKARLIVAVKLISVF